MSLPESEPAPAAERESFIVDQREMFGLLARLDEIGEEIARIYDRADVLAARWGFPMPVRIVLGPNHKH